MKCRFSYFLLCFVAGLMTIGKSSALTANEVLTVYNTRQPISLVSQAAAEYYANVRGLPTCNVLGISTPPTESVSEVEYVNFIASPIWNYLSTHPHIKSIVLCYGIPSRITYQSNYDMSVDSALALLGNPGVPDAQGQFVRHWGLNSTNPYCGKNTDFGRFRDSAENAVQVTVDGQTNIWKLNYLVTRLDAYSQPTVNVNGTAIPRDVKAMIDRSVAALPDGCFVVDRSASKPIKYSNCERIDSRPHRGYTALRNSTFWICQ